MNAELGHRIRELRKQRGLTQRQLAQAVGIDFTYLSKIENDALPYPPSTRTLEKLAGQLEVDELALLRLARKLPAELEGIADSEQGIRFLRQASKFRGPEEWDELFSFLEKKGEGTEER